MTNKITHINSNTPALFAETIQAFKIVESLGKGALDIAVVSSDSRQATEQRILEIGEIMMQNQAKPGEFAEYIFKLRVPDAAGRERAVLKEGQVKRVMVHWAGKSANLMRGLTRREMAKFLKMAPTDSRVTQITKGIQVALLKSLGVRAGWHEGRFRILTAKQSEKKEAKRIHDQIEGNVRAAEDNEKFVQARGAEAIGKSSFSVTLFSELPEVADALQ